MNSSRSFHVRSGKKKETSTFASLLLDLSSNLAEDEVSKLRLAISVDKWVSKRQRCNLKYAADVLHHLHDIELISSTDTKYLEHRLTKIHRKDLVKKIDHYHEKEQRKASRSEETVVKNYVREPDGCKDANSTEFTALKELKCTSTSNRELRSFGDGRSIGNNSQDRVIEKTSKEQEHVVECIPMVVDENSQEQMKLSQMSISDDEKYFVLKTSSFENDVILASQ